MSLIDKLKWRYATKKMDSSKSVPTEQVDAILEAVRLTASSSGLQPYELIVITNPEIREKIKAIANNQTQVTDCSHLIVFAAWDNYTPQGINDAFDMTEKVRNFKNDAGVAYRQMLLKNYHARDPEVNFTHTAKQAYIALGTGLIAAAYEEVMRAKPASSKGRYVKSATVSTTMGPGIKVDPNVAREGGAVLQA